MGNLALTFERGGLFVRIAGTLRSEYLSEVGLAPGDDVFIQQHLPGDISTRYRLSERWTLFANVINVTNEPLEERFGVSGRLRQIEFYSWSAQLGVKFSQ